MTYKTWVEVSRSALVSNIQELKRGFAPGVLFMAVVKSNAYGHGLRETAEIAGAAGADWFGVDNLDESLILRKEGIGAPILILGYTPIANLREAAKNNVSLTVYNRETIYALGKLKLKAKVHIKIETGTSRQGILPDEAPDFVKFVKKFPNIVLEGASTHFANIEDTTDHSYAQKQLSVFKKTIVGLEKHDIQIPIKHIACSAAAMLFPETHFNMARAGIAMYGLWPSRETYLSAKNIGKNIILQPALSWKTRVAQIKTLKKNTPVSYGLTEKVSRDSKIAILPVGYFDGFDRGLSSAGSVIIRGHKCKILGRICMNMCVADITDAPGVKLEDEVILLGRGGKERITAEEIAGKIGTINYEVVSRINPALPRLIKK